MEPAIVTQQYGIGLRIALAIISAIPLLAPYELLLEPYLAGRLRLVQVSPASLTFLGLVVILCLGALFLSAIFLLSAVFGTDKQIEFDPGLKQVRYFHRAGILKQKNEEYSFADITELSIEEFSWSEGEPSYGLVVSLNNRKPIRIGQEKDRGELERLVRRIDEMRLGSGRRKQ